MNARGENAGAIAIIQQMRDMHLPFQLLQQYASVNAILDQLVRDVQNERLNERVRRRQQRENALLAKVEGMVATLHMSKRVITQREISGSLGMSLERLYYYPRVRATLHQYPSCPLRTLTQLHEEDLVERVHAAIAQLRSSGQCVCQEAIRRLVGFSAYMLQKYPLVDSILASLRQEYHLTCKKMSRTMEIGSSSLKTRNSKIAACETPGKKTG